MKKNNLIWITICNILGALLLGSSLASTPTAAYHGPWLALDQSVFYFFNQKLAQGTAFTYFTAFVNLRAFDVVAFVAMLAIFSVVIFAYSCVVTMFVCPKTLLTLSIGIPLLRARVANPCLEQWNEMSLSIPHSFIIFFNGLQILQ